MNKLLLYPKLAINNIKKNGRFYFPYLLTGIASAAMFYIMCFISDNEGISQMPGSSSVQIILRLGTVVVALFVAIFLFYTNSFLMKRRQKEIGLYNILGMEKRHIASILFLETVISGVICLVGGLISGILLSKLILMALCKAIRFSVPFGFEISISAIIITVIVFTGIFMLALLSNLMRIKLANPIELLHGSSAGEHEPKTKWLLTIIGFAALGSGYYIALTTEAPLQAIGLFFIAVILVIIGTYCLFTAGSVAVLKLLRRKKSYYYDPKHFTSVSGLIYRMKQNAVGLANICILSTMVLVMISTTVCLNIGIKDALSNLYPYDILVSGDCGDNGQDGFDCEATMSKIETAIAEEGRTVEESSGYKYLSFGVGLMGNDLITDRSLDSAYTSNNIAQLCLVSADEYAKASGEDVPALADNQVMICSNGKEISGDSFTLLGRTYEIKQRLTSFPSISNFNALLVNTQYIVVKDDAVIAQLYAGQKEAYGDEASEIKYEIGMNIDGSAQQKTDCYNNIFGENSDYDLAGGWESMRADSRQLNENDFYSMYGCFLFLGLFLGTLFMMAAVLIIYYKQISEGYEDKERYAIMQKVGMSRQEIKTSIRSQIIKVFFLPLVMAAIHIAAAFKMITKLLLLFNLTNTMLFLGCTIATVLIFALIYGAVYMLTARTYYKIVS